ncbi:probable deoxycytidylate deaminase [Musca autumnalis]|uniref:probable deoxycytidylate deaminase n=1 Tax=Musca autumnalis TaxID=221902 RepID=UPI003CEDEC16
MATAAPREGSLKREDFYMATALLAEKRSKDPHRQAGAVIVNTEGRIVSVGYNGFPSACKNGNSRLSWNKTNDPTSLDNKHLYVVHAEANAILKTTQLNIRGATIYQTLYPCNECTKLILSSGIEKVYYLHKKNNDARITDKGSERMFEVAGVPCLKYIPQNTSDIRLSFKDPEDSQ